MLVFIWKSLSKMDISITPHNYILISTSEILHQILAQLKYLEVIYVKKKLLILFYIIVD